MRTLTTPPLACVVCDGDEPTVPVGADADGAPVYACAECCGEEL